MDKQKYSFKGWIPVFEPFEDNSFLSDEEVIRHLHLFDEELESWPAEVHLYSDLLYEMEGGGYLYLRWSPETRLRDRKMCKGRVSHVRN